VQAELLPDSKERQKAIAWGYMLDPLSERIGRLPKKYVKAAVDTFGKTNPFR